MVKRGVSDHQLCGGYGHPFLTLKITRRYNMGRRWILIGMIFLLLPWFLVGCGIAQEEYDAVVAERDSYFSKLQSTQNELISTKNDLSSAKVELQSIKIELDSTETELLVTKQEVSSAKDEVNSIEMELNMAEASLNSKKSELTEINDTLQTTRNVLAEREAELSYLQVSYDGLITGHGYTIRDPTYIEMISFIQADRTDGNNYIRDEYDCDHFAADVGNNAEEEGIRCAYVVIDYPEGWSHIIVAFDTVDRGLIYVDPQTDNIVEIEIGKPYHQCVVLEPGYFWEVPEYDDTIKSVLIVW